MEHPIYLTPEQESRLNQHISSFSAVYDGDLMTSIMNVSVDEDTVTISFVTLTSFNPYIISMSLEEFKDIVYNPLDDLVDPVS